MKKNPLITIIVTTYNSDLNYFSECMYSIINQSYKNTEILIIDDFSSKKNYLALKSLLKKKFKDNRIKVYQNKKNYGVSKSLNQGINFSKGKYITWCSYDDYFHHNKILLQYNKIKNLDNTIVSCNSFVKYQNYNFFRKVNYEFLSTNKDSLILSDKFSGGTFLIPKKIIIKCGKFNEKLKFTQDYDMWLRFYDHNIKFANLNKYLFFSRIHMDQDTNKKSKKVMIEKKNFYLRYFKKNLPYFLNFYSFYELIKINISFRIRGYFNLSEFISKEILKFNKIKKKKLLIIIMIILRVSKYTSNFYNLIYSYFRILIITILNLIYYFNKMIGSKNSK